jgi:hypothetical protein
MADPEEGGGSSVPEEGGGSSDTGGSAAPAEPAPTDDGATDPAATAEGSTGEESTSGESTGEESTAEEPTREELRERVDQEYDFDEFGPADMAEMSADEWEVAFEQESWITGEQLLDRLEADLRSRIATRDVFAVVERAANPPRLVAYSDEGYAVVGADGSIEGRGTVLRDVKPSVALASMPEYDVPDDPPDEGLPAPDEVPTEGSDLGNLMVQLVAGALLLCGLVLLGAPLAGDLGGGAIVAVVTGLAFVVTALFLGLLVANARLSARFRAEEYRDRLRAAGVAEGDRPEFLPLEDHEFEDASLLVEEGSTAATDAGDTDAAASDAGDTDAAATDAGDADAEAGAPGDDDGPAGQDPH